MRRAEGAVMEERRMISGWLGMRLAAALVVGGFCGVVRAGDDAFDPSLSELLDQEVTTVSRKSERLGDAPSAIYVLTADELSRLGVTSLPRGLAPCAGRAGGGAWAQSLGGIDPRLQRTLRQSAAGAGGWSVGLFAAVLRHLLGWRWTYRSAISSGSRWCVAPAAVRSGANAVNGVINIITRHSRATRGTELRAATGKRLAQPDGPCATAATGASTEAIASPAQSRRPRR